MDLNNILILISCAVFLNIFFLFLSLNSSQKNQSNSISFESKKKLEEIVKFESYQKSYNNTEHESIPHLDLDKIFNLSYQSSETKCIFNNFTYTKEEFDSYWRFETYGKCPTGDEDNIVINNNSISIECSNGRKPSIAVESGTQQYFGGNASLPKYKENFNSNIENAEYIIVQCSPNSKKPFVFNRFKKSISEKAQKVRESIKINTKPLTVILLALDSVSRESAIRNLPNSIDFLNYKHKEMFSGKYSAYDFKYSNTFGHHTQYNMSPILIGESYRKIEDYLSGIDLNQINNLKFKEIQKNPCCSILLL